MEWASEITEAVASFDPTLPIERALTPPASWYTEPGFAELDRQAVFARNWVCAGTLADLRETGCYIAGELLGISWLVVRDGMSRDLHTDIVHPLDTREALHSP